MTVIPKPSLPLSVLGKICFMKLAPGVKTVGDCWFRLLGDVVVVQALSDVRLFVTPWTAACQASLSITISLSLLKLMSTESVMPPNHLILGHPLLLSSIFPNIRFFFHWVGFSHQVASDFPKNTQGWFTSGLTGLISLQSKGLSRVFSITTVQTHPFFGTQPSLWSDSHIHTWLLEK